MPAPPESNQTVDPVLSAAVATYFQKRDKGETISVGDLATSFPGTEPVVLELSVVDEWLSRMTAPFREPNTAGVQASPDDSDTRPPAPPQHELLSPLGKGAMGVVFRARHTELGREVAVKYIQSGVLANEDARKRFRREAQTLAALNHPHVVHVYDCGRVGGYDYCVMELVNGGTLGDRITGQPWTAKQATEVMEKLALGVGAIHKAGVVHRDLKPANVFMTHDGTVKVGDFGLARSVEGPAVTGTGAIVGTPWYMSPEQSEGKALGPAADVWALGVIYHQLLTGRVPFPGTNPMHTFKLIRTTKPELPMGTDPAILAIAKRCLASRPEDRYADASEFAQALADALVTLARDQEPATTINWRPPQRRSRLPWGVGIVAAFLVVAVLGITIGWKGEPAEQPSATPTSALVKDLPAPNTAERLKIVAADLRSLPEGTERDLTRYFSVDHLPTELQRRLVIGRFQQVADRLRAARSGKGLRGPLRHEHSGVYAIDLREWGWDALRWLETVAKADPYRVQYTKGSREDVRLAGEELRQLTAAPVLVRGDWFLARLASLSDGNPDAADAAFATNYRQSALDLNVIAREYGVVSPDLIREVSKHNDTLTERDPFKQLLQAKTVTRGEWESITNGTSLAQELARAMGLGTPIAVVGGVP